MAKPDFLPLLPPGMHNVTVQGIHALAVAPFAQDQRRHDLHQKLAAWVGALQAVGVGGTLWLDGSFLTQKLGPGDIDCVLWSPQWINGGANVTATMQQQVTRLLDKAAAENLFGLDLYVETPAPNMVLHREAYWRGIFGFGHDRRTAKGFAEINL